MLKKSASIVLAALRGSTYRSVRLASSLAAALLDGLFEHPADYSGTAAYCGKTKIFRKLLGCMPPQCLLLPNQSHDKRGLMSPGDRSVPNAPQCSLGGR